MTSIPSHILASDDYTSYVTKVNIPESVEEIGSYAFYKCENIDVSVLPSKLKTIGGYAFNGCTKITEISIPNTITSIGYGAFKNCTSLETVNMSYNSTVEYKASIEGWAFGECTSLKNVNLSENVTSIEDEVFRGCTALETLILPESLTYMGYEMIESTAISSITIPKNVKSCDESLHNGPLANCKTLKMVTFEEGMTSIPGYILASRDYTSYVTKVIIPASVEEIGSCAFYKCENMTIYGYTNSYAQQYANENDIPFVSVAIAKNATVSDVLSHIDLNNLISNISLGNTTINGPTVTIGGKTFSLFSFNAAATLKLNDKVQAKVDMEKKTIQVLIGFDKFNGSAKLDKDTNSSNYWKESYAQVKSLYKGVAGANASTDKLYHGFQKLRGKLRQTDCAIGVKASAEVAGYAEFSFASGEVSYTSGGIMLKASVGYEETQHLPPCPAVYVVFGLNADFNGKLSLQRTKEMQYTPAMNANIDLTATLGAGAGSKKLNTYAEIGLKGSVKMGVKLPASSLSESLTAKLTASTYLDSKVFGFNGPSYGPEEFASVQIYPPNDLSSASIGDDDDFSTENLQNAEKMDRNYLKADDTLSGAASDDEIFVKQNLYPYNDAKIVSMDDGTKVMFWIDDNGEKSDINRTTLMYSVYDGKAWSDAVGIAETGGANDYPNVYSDGKRAVVVWQKAGKLNDNSSLTDVLNSVDLYAVTYESGKLGQVEQITKDNTVYEMMQTVAVDGDKMAVAWVENSENNPFQASGNNTVKVAIREDGKWTEKTVVTGTDTINNINIAYVSGELTLVYETKSDDECTVHFEKGNVKKTYNGQGAQIENGILYYSDNESVKSYDILTGYEDDLGLSATSDFVMIDNLKTKELFTTVYNGYTSELAMYKFDSSTGKWGDMVTLTDYGKYIRSYSAAMDSDGNTTIALNLVTVNDNGEQIYGDSRLVVIDQSDYTDLALTDNISYEENLVKPGEKLPISFEVKNNGSKTIEKFNASILDESGNTLTSQTVRCTIASGAISSAQIVYELPDNIAFHKVTLKIQADGESNMSDNAKDISIGYADLALDNIYISGKRAESYLEGVVSNSGYADAKNVKINLYYGDSDTAFQTLELNDIKAGKTSEWKTSVPEEYMVVNPLANGNLIRVEVVSDTEELRYDNNENQFLILADDIKMALNATSLDLKTGDEINLKVAYCDNDITDKTIIWTSSDEKVATVTEGKVTAIGQGVAVITATVNGVSAKCEISVTDNEITAVQEVMINVASANIMVGESQNLTASVFPASAQNSKFTWSSEDDTVATVSESGKVTGVSVGETTIKAVAEDGYHFATCNVIVSQDENQTYTISFTGGEGTSGRTPSPVTGVAGTVVKLPDNPYTKTGMKFTGWSDGTNTYEEGSSYRIPYHDVTLEAKWNEEGKIEYSINATAGKNGAISPSGEIKVEGGKNQTFSIIPDDGYEIEDVEVDNESVGPVSEYTFENVEQAHTIYASFKKKPEGKIYVEKIEMSKTNAEMKVGETLVLTATVTPDNATDKELSFSSSDEKVAFVDSTGVVTAMNTGTAVISATAKDGSGTVGKCEITVHEIQAEKEKQILSGTESMEKVYGDSAFNIDVELIKGDGNLTYESSDNSVVTVNNSGRVVIRGAGNATVKVIAEETDKYDIAEMDISINVSKAEQKLEGVESYTKNTKDSDFVLNIIQSDGDGDVSYKSSDNSVVTVNNSGKISIIGKGIATITVTASETDNYKTAVKIINITVNEDNVIKPAKVGTVLSDSKTKGKYKVTSSNIKNPSVSYYKTSDKKAKTITVPSSIKVKGITYKVTAIADNALKNNKVVTKVTIGANTKIIGKNAFYGCSRLKTVTMGKNVLIIDSKAFYKCTGITKLILPGKLTTIGDSAFTGCNCIKSITIPLKVKKVGRGIFSNCKKIKNITIKTKLLNSKNVSKDAFKGVGTSTVISVPKSKLKAYKSLFVKRGLNKKIKIKGI